MSVKVDTFANRLDKAMRNNNVNQTELSEKTKLYGHPISQSLINKYLKNKAFARQDKLTILAILLNTNEAWLMGYDVSNEPNSSHIDYKDYENIKASSNNLSLEEKKEKILQYMSQYNIDSLFPIPVYSEVRKDMFDTGDKHITEYIPINPKLYNLSASEQYFYIKIFDDSMNFRYKQGDYVLMQKSSAIKEDTISLVLIDKNIYIRKINKQGALILLEPMSNNTRYKTQAYAKDKITILGIVIGYMGKE